MGVVVWKQKMVPRYLVTPAEGWQCVPLGSIDRVSPRHVDVRHPTVDADLLFDNALHCCGPRRYMGRLAHTLFFVSPWVLWVPSHRGPCWT